MRKVLLCVLTMCLSFIIFATASADTLDLSTYSDDEIVILLQQVQQEIVDRRIQKTATLPAGSYIVGKDIPSGSYIAYMKYDGGWWGDIYVYADGGDGKQKFSGTVFALDNSTASIRGEGSWKIVLEDGDLLKCSSEMTLTISAGVLFQ